MALRNTFAMILVVTTFCLSVCHDRVASADCSGAYFGCMDPTLLTKIQKTLIDKGFAPGKADGQYGASTERALKQFANNRNIRFFDKYMTPSFSEALFGIRIDYLNATDEQRQKFYSKLGIPWSGGTP
jgi:hypothetical protein